MSSVMPKLLRRHLQSPQPTLSTFFAFHPSRDKHELTSGEGVSNAVFTASAPLTLFLGFLTAMSADFWAGYAGGAIGIVVGNPLDLIKTRLQASSIGGHANSSLATRLPWSKQFEHWTAFARGATAPILGYGALNGLLFMTYNRSLALMTTGNLDLQGVPTYPEWWKIWAAGALGGLAIFFVSAPTELVKCRAQVSNPPKSSPEVAKELWKAGGLRAMYMGGGITSVRDSVGYGFYFWSYQLCKQALTVEDESERQQTLKILLCGGVAGVVTWTSIFPLDALKTRVQTWNLIPREHRSADTRPLLDAEHTLQAKNSTLSRPSTLQIAKEAYQVDGLRVFFRGIGICNARAFFVNAVQFFVYEWMMKVLAS